MKKILLISYMICCACIFSNAQPCSFSRPDIYTYTAAERLQLRNLIFDYLRTQINSSVPSGPARYPLIDMHSMHSGMIHGTGTKAFTTWHRYYIQGLENWLIDNGHSKYVPLPSWDPTTAIPNEFFNSLAGSSAQIDAGFNNNANQTITPPSITNFVGSAACSHSSDDDFSDDLETNYHNAIHGLIGGSSGAMSFVPTAPGSAIFWLYHAWIDDLWFCYQRNCDGLTQDQYVRDDNNDNGTEPSSASALWVSPDIWARNNNDGFQNQVSEDLIQSPGKVAYVYVRVWNKGNRPSDDGSGNVTVYWAKGNTALGWTAPWDGSTTINCGGTARPLGGMISSQPLRRVNENFNDFTMAGNPLEKDYYIYEFAFTIPDPDWYSPCFPNPQDQRHFCLLAKLNDGHSMGLTSDLYYDLRQFNNMAMKNIAIVGDGAMSIRHGGVLWGNVSSDLMHNVCLGVKFPNVSYTSLFEQATVRIKLDAASTAEWLGAGAIGENITHTDAGEIFVTGDNARICGFHDLAPNTIKSVDIAVNPIEEGGTITGHFEFDLVQYKEFMEVVGGERYLINPATADDGGDGGMEGRPGVQHTAITAVADAYSIYPNPTSNTFQIQSQDGKYNIEVRVFDNLGRCVKVFTKVNKGSMLSLEGLAHGLYIVKIINNTTKSVSTQKLLLEK